MQDIYLDVCSLIAPEPVVRIIDALTELEPPARLAVHMACKPGMLYEVLERHAFCHSLAQHADHSYDLLIWHRA